MIRLGTYVIIKLKLIGLGNVYVIIINIIPTCINTQLSSLLSNQFLPRTDTTECSSIASRLAIDEMSVSLMAFWSFLEAK
jgi:hypothetical protein